MLCFCALLFASEVAAQERVQADEGFPWGTHLITVPLVLLFGVFIGWSLRERKYAQDQALREIEEDHAKAKKSD